MIDAAELQRARTLVDLDRDAQARELLARLLAEDPENHTALCLFAQACLGTEDYRAAADAARAACRIAPDDEWAYRLAALALAHAQRPDEARMAADAAVRLAPHDWRPHVARAQIDLIGPCVTDSTAAAAGEAVRLAPSEADAHRILGSVQLERRRHAVADVHFREALKLDPQNAAARNELARLNLRKHRLGRAAAGFASAAALNPTDEIAARNLMVVWARTLRVVHLVLWAVMFTAGRFAVHENGGSRGAGVLAFVAATLALGAFGVQLWRDSRPRTVQLVRIVVRRDRLLAAWLGCLVVAYGGLAAAAVLTAGGQRAAVGACALALLVGVIFSWVRARHAR